MFLIVGYMNSCWKTINWAIVVSLVLFAGIYSVFKDDFSTYWGISLGIATLFTILWSYAIFHTIVDIMEIEKRPIWYSTSLFPIYKFNPDKNDLEDHYAPTVALFCGLFMLLLWGFLTNIMVSPSWLGATITIGIELFMMVAII